MLTLSFFPKINVTTGIQEELSWEDAAERLTSFEQRKNKDGWLYSPAMYQGEPQRQDLNVIGMSAVVIDFDNSVGTGKKAKPSESPTLPDDHADNLDGLAYIYHSTHSNKPDWPKWRLVLPLSRPVPPAAWPAVFAGAMALLGNDDNIDQTSKDLSRSFYMPSCPADMFDHAFADAIPGDLVDPEYLVELSGMPVEIGPISATPERPNLPTERISTPGRNNTLKQIVGACLERGEALERIVSEVLRVDAAHEPPLFNDPDETQYAGLSPETAAIKFVASVIVSTNRNRIKCGMAPELPYIRDEAAYPAPPVEIDPTAKIEEVVPLPPHVLNPGGFLGQLATWIDRCAIKPQPVLSLAAAIAACAVLMGRKVQTETGLRTNLFIIGLGETSCGKENARQRVKDLFTMAGCASYLGPEEIASDSGLLRAVKMSPALLMQIDEIGYMLRSVKSDSAKSYKADIVPTLMKLDSAASSVLIGRAYAGAGKKGKDGDSNEREDIQQPCVCLYGSSVPCRFLKALTPDEILDGFIPRLLVFESDNPNPRRVKVDIEATEPPDFLIHRLQAWKAEATGQKGNLVGYTGPDNDIPRPRVVKFTDAARVMFDQFEELIRAEQDKVRLRGLHGLWGKAEAMAMKLSLIHACSYRMETSEIDHESAAWAIELVVILTRNMLLRAEMHIASNQMEADLKKLLRDIQSSGVEGIGHTELYKRNRKYGSKAFKDLLASLYDMGEIFAKEVLRGGKKQQKRYFASVFAKG